MIVSRTPLRISFFGGGTDYPAYFKDGVAGGIFPNDGGLESAPKNDLEFYALSGSIKKENPKLEDYWHLAPLKAAISKLK